MRNSYTEILQHKLEIPIIQRDYAQGRTDDKTKKIRKDFLDVLFDKIKHKHEQSTVPDLELDFIYGFNNDEESKDPFSFIPIDGQQRLTTLWLLYWMVAAKENVTEQEKSFLSNFVYETRHSTTVFCKKLIKFVPFFSDNSITEEIKDQSWYFETWDFDPSIQAMLVVLSDIEARYNHLSITTVWNVIGGANCPFYFYKLDMKRVGLTDDLYIKMNSRGKALTEFEYFKAGFAEILKDPEQKKRFEKSVDQDWIEAIWNIVLESENIESEDDIALTVDSCFLNLFNFITSVIAFKKDWRYKDTVASAEMLKIIYSDIANQETLFKTLDAICRQQTNNPEFWVNAFYYNKDGFNSSKTRLYFPRKEVNLLKRCLFHYADNSGLSYPEQLLLHACFTYFKTGGKDFENRIRIIRNLAVNSENELRPDILGNSFEEVEKFILNGDILVFEYFKTAQIEEEKRKEQFLVQYSGETNRLKRLEDSDIFRGSISLVSLDQNFGLRSEKFLELFDEDAIISDFNKKCDLLLCFGDYTQDHRDLTNLMSPIKTVIRSFFTTPGFNKTQFYSKTQKVLHDCLDYFVANPNISVDDKIKEKIVFYASNPKDWIYYFIKYHSFRSECTRGYYKWHNGDYGIWKMRVRQFNGYHWDPFLQELTKSINSVNLTLGNFGLNSKLLLSINTNKIFISTIPKGFLFENGMNSNQNNPLLDDLTNTNVISSSGELLVSQTNNGLDLEDRVEKVSKVIDDIINKNNKA